MFNPTWTLSGYVRTISAAQWNSVDKELNSVNWLHARLNLVRRFSSHFQIRTDLRSQVYGGDALANLPNFKTGFRQPDEAVNLHTVWWKRPRSLAHTNVERLVATYERGNGLISLGRQRIHWGMAVGWNPNDLFQVGNVFDPDYLERPGSDAIRARKTLGELSGIEWAAAWTGPGRSRGGLRYYFNRLGFDFQGIVGWLDKQPMLGAGWSGSLGGWGFRGELQSFLSGSDQPAYFQSTLEFDRLMKNDSYFRIAALYNLAGSTDPVKARQAVRPEVRQLMPGTWNASIGWSRDLSLRLNWGLDLYYTTAGNSTILLPRAQWSLTKNWDVLLTAQWLRVWNNPQSYCQILIRLGHSF